MTKYPEMQSKLKSIYDFIRSRQKESGLTPSIREIRDKFGIKSTSSVAYYLRKLEEEGLIILHNNQSRGIELQDKSAALDDYIEELPLLGQIHAGEPVISFENVLDTYPIPKFMLPMGQSNCFLLRVEGSSMIEAGINSGDFILIKKQNTAENGQIVAALVNNDSTTVKRYFKENSVVRLHPENKNMSDIYPTDVTILGLVIGLIRTRVC